MSDQWSGIRYGVTCPKCSDRIDLTDDWVSKYANPTPLAEAASAGHSWSPMGKPLDAPAAPAAEVEFDSHKALKNWDDMCNQYCTSPDVDRSWIVEFAQRTLSTFKPAPARVERADDDQVKALKIGLHMLSNGWDDAEHAEDMARVGSSLMDAIDANKGHELIKSWSPAEDPAEIVADLINAYDEKQVARVEATDEVLVKWIAAWVEGRSSFSEADMLREALIQFSPASDPERERLRGEIIRRVRAGNSVLAQLDALDAYERGNTIAPFKKWPKHPMRRSPCNFMHPDMPCNQDDPDLCPVHGHGAETGE